MSRPNTAGSRGIYVAKALHSIAKNSGHLIHVDGRLHRWEWLSLLDGCMLKSVAAGHADADELVIPQDVAWASASAIL
jgi:hypothetical protein